MLDEALMPPRRGRDRRGFLKSALVTAGALCALALPASFAFAEEVTIRVATSGGGWDKTVTDIVGPELAKDGIKVEIVVGTDREHLAKLIAARGREAPFDVVEFTDVTSKDMIGGGFVDKMDLSKMSSVAELLPGRFNEYRIPNWSVQWGILVNRKAFESLGVPVPTRFSDLADPKLAGKVLLVPVTNPGAASFLVASATDAGGGEQNLEPGFDYLKTVAAPNSFWRVSTDILTQFQADSVVAAVTHAGLALRARKGGMDLDFIHPQVAAKKGISLQGYYGVVKGSPHAEAAQKFIDIFASARGQEEMSRRSGNIPINSAALKVIAAEPAISSLWLSAPDDVANLFAVDYDKLDMQAMTDGWANAVNK